MSSGDCSCWWCSWELQLAASITALRGLDSWPLEFPAVTICNLNLFTATSLETAGLRDVEVHALILHLYTYIALFLILMIF